MSFCFFLFFFFFYQKKNGWKNIHDLVLFIDPFCFFFSHTATFLSFLFDSHTCSFFHTFFFLPSEGKEKDRTKRRKAKRGGEKRKCVRREKKGKRRRNKKKLGNTSQWEKQRRETKGKT
mmetsp:Transcript_9957/g.19667  ORF Transcript_9957/g.19667 Transcript_9957/m.19667 type:complete len:119 (+) Transcript_9957:466-822(+)